MDNLDLWLIFTIPTVAAIAIAILAQIFVVPWQRKKILRVAKGLATNGLASNGFPSKDLASNGVASNGIIVNTVSKTLNDPAIQDPEKAIRAEIDTKEEGEQNVNILFNFLQILSAVFSSFAHGGNDVRLVQLFFEGQYSKTITYLTILTAMRLVL